MLKCSVMAIRGLAGRATGLRVAGVVLLATMSMGQLGCPPKPENCSTFGYADIGNHTQLAYKYAGTGGPVVVLLSGLGDNSTIWEPVMNGISQFTTVLVYNRGGVGCSKEGTDPRTVEVVAEELKTFLDVLGLHEPVILCAHSFGGLHARYFANQHPERVAGMVLVDATHEDLDDELARRLDPRSLAEQDLAFGVYFNAIAGSIGAVGEYYNKNYSYRLVREHRTLPDVPFIYLAAVQYIHDLEDEGDEDLAEDIKAQFDRDHAALVSQGKLVKVKSSHDIHRQSPQTVIDAVWEVHNTVTNP